MHIVTMNSRQLVNIYILSSINTWQGFGFGSCGFVPIAHEAKLAITLKKYLVATNESAKNRAV